MIAADHAGKPRPHGVVEVHEALVQLHELAVFDGGVLDGLQALCAVYLLFLLVDIDAQVPVGAVGRINARLDVGGDETGYETEADTHHLVLAGRQTAQ